MAARSAHTRKEIHTADHKPSRSKRRVLLIGLPMFVGACLGVLALQPRQPQLAWNYTESVPLGLYRIDQSSPHRGDLVAVTPTGTVRETLNRYDALPANRLLIKYLAAGAGDTVCRKATAITINGKLAATARKVTRTGVSLPSWEGCRKLSAGQIFLLAPHPLSFDGRYFGPTDASQIVGLARPLFLLTEGASS